MFQLCQCGVISHEGGDAIKARKLKITRVWTERKVDESPDTSHLGEYSNKPKEHAIDREERGTVDRGGFRYFNPANHHNIDEWGGVTDLDVLKAYARDIQAGHHELDREAMCEALNGHYREQDYQRMESLQRGGWHFVGVIAKAEIVSPRGVSQVIRSGGLWGVESDSGKDYFTEVEREELAALRAELESLGIGPRAVTRAFRNMERKGPRTRA